MYIHEHQDWPRFRWVTDRLAEPLASVRHGQGRLIGRMESLGFNLQQEMDWFLGCLGRAIDGAQTILGAVLAKARFWESIRGIALNERQMLVLNRLLDGFEGKLTTSKYAKLTKSSQDTALRDILPLVERGILVRGPEGGRSTSYALANIYQGEGDAAYETTNGY